MLDSYSRSEWIPGRYKILNVPVFFSDKFVCRNRRKLLRRESRAFVDSNADAKPVWVPNPNPNTVSDANTGGCVPGRKSERHVYTTCS